MIHRKTKSPGQSMPRLVLLFLTTVLVMIGYGTCVSGQEATDSELPQESKAPPAEIEKTPPKLDAEAKLQAYKKWLDENEQVDDAQKTKIRELVDSLQNEDPVSRETITTALRELYAEFSTAIHAYENGENEEANNAFVALLKSEDPFVTADSSYFLAKSYMDLQQYEQALPLLKDITGANSSFTLHAGEAIFLRGICQTHLLKRKAAVDSFAEFLRANPGASERQRVTAWRQIELLSFVRDGTLFDVHEKMRFSQRRLELENSDKPTRDVQEQVVSILDKLIKEAEEREATASGEGTGEPKSAGKGGGSKPGMGGSKDNDLTPYKTVRKIQTGDKRTPWDHLRDNKRDARALAALKEKYPARYRELIEQYYLSLQENPEP